jgi:hypothetical protein
MCGTGCTVLLSFGFGKPDLSDLLPGAERTRRAQLDGPLLWLSRGARNRPAAAHRRELRVELHRTLAGRVGRCADVVVLLPLLGCGEGDRRPKLHFIQGSRNRGVTLLIRR